MLNQKLTGSSAAEKTYIEDVFSTYLYTGNGSTQTINNGIDLAGKGGLVWIKMRNAVSSNRIWDSTRSLTGWLQTDTTDAVLTNSDGIASFNSDGFTAGSGVSANGSGLNYASWTFRKAPKFFDVVTYTGNGVDNRTISHSLGQTPGMVIIKKTNTTSDWFVWHRSLTSPRILKLNTTAADASFPYRFDPAPTDTNFGVGSPTLGATELNNNGDSYVAYLFAHDTTTDGMIQCGSFTTDGSGNATVNLGYEPQYVMYKAASTTSSWFIQDNMRGFTIDQASPILYPNLSNAENAGASPYVSITSTGFKVNGANLGLTSTTFIYMAIRRPMKVPTDGTKVFKPIARTGTSSQISLTGFGFAPDTYYSMSKLGDFTNGTAWWDKLRGVVPILKTSGTGAEITTYSNAIKSFDNDGMTLLADGSAAWVNYSSTPYINYAFKRAPGFFDVVCYTGTGVARTVNHNLGVAPELMIVKCRNSSTHWFVSSSKLTDPNGSYLLFNSDSVVSGLSGLWTTPTTTTFGFDTGFGGNSNWNGSGANYVAYLFASCPGVSKVGSYTGNGSSQTINCGFAAGARFVLIKRTDSTGDWYVWDTARGVVAGSDPHLSLNTTAAEVTTDDTIDPDSSGFIVNQVAATNVNVSSASYIYLAIA